MENTHMPQLVLYYMPSCPYCQKVLTYMKRNDVEITLKDTFSNRTYSQELMQLGGKTQVPCLVIDGKALYESEDIIAWFKENWKKLKQAW